MQFSRRQFLAGAIHSAAPQITPIDQFYRQQIRHIPNLSSEHWTITIKGLVEQWLVLQYSSLLDLPAIDVTCTLACLGNMPGGSLIGHAIWRGVRLSTLFEQAGLRANARFAHFYSADGYVTCLEIDQLQNALLAYQMNGVPLSTEHGFPARLIMPGLYGYKMPKWIMRIEPSDYAINGFWEQRGWSQHGTVQTTSAFLTPRAGDQISDTVHLAGYAFAGQRDITRVEVSVDDGDWTHTTLQSGEPHRWSNWYIDWTPGAPGDYVLRVRATDSEGFTQPEQSPMKPFPNGSSGLHKIVVRVVAQ